MWRNVSNNLEPICPRNSSVICEDQTKCRKCGFTEAVHRKRVERIRAALSESKREKVRSTKRAKKEV